MQKSGMLLDKLPSNRRELLEHIQRAKISSMTRYSWYQPNEAAEEIEDLYDAPAKEVFRRTTGGLVIALDSGINLGFGSADSIASVSLWEAKANDFENDEDNEFFPIDACDPDYSEEEICQLLGKQIIQVSILKRNHEDPLYEHLPCEAGLVLKFENEFEFIVSHGLSENIDNFAIIHKYEVSRKILDQLQEIPL
jgi:hypothetical protein